MQPRFAASGRVKTPRAGAATFRACFPSPRRSHAAIMRRFPTTQLPEFMAQFRACQSVAARGAWNIAILTACRSGEVLCARWERDRSRQGGLGNSRTPHEGWQGASRAIVGPSRDAILTALKEIAHQRFRFPWYASGKPLSAMAMAMQLRRMNAGNITVHGFRSHLPGLGERNHGVPA